MAKRAELNLLEAVIEGIVVLAILYGLVTNSSEMVRWIGYILSSILLGGGVLKLYFENRARK